MMGVHYFFKEGRWYKELQLIRKRPYHAIIFYIKVIAKIVMGFENSKTELIALLDEQEPKKKNISSREGNA